ncbi:acyl-CoA N-acyltransferase [Fistulina hepatica ATCC 64428]|uniref:histone acetyltransferase n=1 Tax=Fistulina hepatica ATCC 64428 TaxID=1128425 RepID=A0A0D7AFI3_9AGAR|nr:acyl-CoA N-acyltransferase [Fistulina hepatica ATCC 64428]
MPAKHTVCITEAQVYTLSHNGIERDATVLERQDGKAYVHYLNSDKRLDEWVPESNLTIVENKYVPENLPRDRKRHGALSETSDLSSFVDGVSTTSGEVVMTEEDYDLEHHKRISARRNFDVVQFGHWQIKTWYVTSLPVFSCGEILENDNDDAQSSLLRLHGRTLDVMAGGITRGHASGVASTLWVCEMCFKYMHDGLTWESHQRSCHVMHPPGRKVYQRGAHTIWEVDGGEAKLYCQCLSLFGKLFIDVKTLYFDTENFMYYVLTDASAKRDHMIGFFSKEKVSYDDYNLACILTLPPYQRKGYGMLMIEFSKIGTPERPLSDLGLRSYLAYWVATIVRVFRRVLSITPPGVSKIVHHGSLLELFTSSPPSEPDGRRRKRTKGWEGEAGDRCEFADKFLDDPVFTSLRSLETTANPDGSAHTHVYSRCTLQDIARVTHLREEDAAFALNEIGLLNRRITLQDSGTVLDGGDRECIVFTREMIEHIAVERNVKPPCMNLAYVLLPDDFGTSRR